MKPGTRTGVSRLRWAALATVTMLIAAACGSDEPSDTAATTAPAASSDADEQPATSSDDEATDSEEPATDSVDEASTPSTTPSEADDEPELEPLKIGLLLPYTGSLALYGSSIESSVRAYFDVNAPINGRNVEFVTYDTEMSPEVGLAGAQSLVERDDVDVIVGPVFGPVVLAVAQYLDGGDVPVIGPIPQTDIENFPLNFSTGFHAWQIMEPFGRYAAEVLGHETAYLFASDFAYGRDVVNGFRAGFEAGGGSIVGEAYPPLGTTDMVPYLPTGVDADVAFGFTPGADAIRWVKQFDENGLKDEMSLVAYGMVSKLTLGAIGDSALGVESITQYPEGGLDSPAYQEYLEVLTGRVPEDPPISFPHASGYATAQAIAVAMADLDAEFTPQDLIDAIAAAEFDSPWGPLKFDPASGYPYVPGYHVRVVEVDGELTHEILDEYGALSPAEALAAFEAFSG